MDLVSSDQVRANLVDRREVLVGAAAALVSTAMPAAASRRPESRNRGHDQLQLMTGELAAAKVIPAMAVLEVRGGQVFAEDVWGVREAGSSDWTISGRR